jgi:hypothetical protein
MKNMSEEKAQVGSPVKTSEQFDMKEIVQKVEERKRITQQMLDELRKIEDFVVEQCEKMNAYPTLAGYDVITRRSNIGYATYLVDCDSGNTIPPKVSEIGGAFYLHGDFHASVGLMSRGEIIALAKNIGKFLKELQQFVKNKVAEEQSLTETLRKINAALLA